MSDFDAKAPHPSEAFGDSTRLLQQPGLVRGESRVEARGISAEQAGNLCKAEAQNTQRDDFLSARHLGRSISPPPGPGPARSDKAAPLIESQRLDRDSEAVRRLGGSQIAGGGAHDLPLQDRFPPLSARPVGPGQGPMVG